MANSLIVGAIRALLTADTAEFTKKMAAATGDVKDLATALQKDLEPRQKAVNNAVRDFLGGTEIRRAEEYAAAVKKIGDVNKLTEADQRKVNRAVEEALAHYRALGIEAPAHLQKLATATAGAAKQTGILDSQFAKMTAAFGAGALIDRAVTGLFSLGAQAFESAGQIVDLSNKTGLSIEAVQRYGYVADQTGTTVEAFADAVFKLGVKTEEGSLKQRRAVEALGLVWADFKELAPEKQLDAVMRALAGVTSTQERNKLGVDVLGKSYKDLAGSVNDYAHAMDESVAAGDREVKAMDDAADAAARMMDKIEKSAIGAFGRIAIGLERVTKNKQNFAAFLSGVVLNDWSHLGGMANQPPDEAPGAGTFRTTITAGAETESATSRLVAATKVLNGLSAAQRQNLKDAIALGSGLEDLIDQYDLTADAVALLSKYFSDQEKAIGKLEEARKKAEKAQLDRVEDLNDLLDDTAKANEERIKDEEKIANAYKWTTATLQGLIAAEKDRIKLISQIGKPVSLGVPFTPLDMAGPTSIEQFGPDGFFTKQWQAQQQALADASKRAAGDTEKAWDEALGNTSQLFVNLGQVSGDSLGGMMKFAGQAIVSVDALAGSIKKMSDAKTWQEMSAASAEFAVSMFSIIGGVNSFMEARTDEQSIQDWKNARIRWMQELSDSLKIDLNLIEDLSAETLDHIAFFTRNWTWAVGETAARAEAEAMHLSEIIKAIGGLSAENAADFEARVLPIFDVIARGGFEANLALKELAKLVDVFADQAETTGGLWSANLQTIIAKSRELGVGLERITQLMDAELGKLGSATGAMVGGLVQGLAPATKAIDDLKKKQKELEGQGDTEGAAAIGKDIAAKAASAAAENQAEFDRLNRIALASFNAFIGQGHSAREAITEIGPAIDSLQASADTFGFAYSDAFGELSRMRDLFTDNAGLLDSITGVNDVMTALANVGALTADTFADLQAQGVAGFEQLTAAGFSETEALTQIAPLLDNVIQLHKDRGLAIDDETQKLIDQAGEQGLLAEEQLDTVEVLQQGLGAIIELLGGDLPAAWKGMSDDAADAAADMEKKMKAAADEIDRQFKDLEFTVPVDFEASGNIPGFDPDAFRVDVPGYAMGTGGYRDFGSGTLAELHGVEKVVPFGAEDGAGGAVNITVVTTLDGREVARNQVKHLPRTLQLAGL